MSEGVSTVFNYHLAPPLRYCPERQGRELVTKLGSGYADRLPAAGPAFSIGPVAARWIVFAVRPCDVNERQLIADHRASVEVAAHPGRQQPRPGVEHARIPEEIRGKERKGIPRRRRRVRWQLWEWPELRRRPSPASRSPTGPWVLHRRAPNRITDLVCARLHAYYWRLVSSRCPPAGALFILRHAQAANCAVLIPSVADGHAQRPVLLMFVVLFFWAASDEANRKSNGNMVDALPRAY